MTSTGGLPAGAVTFVFTDIEGSTRLLQDLGAEQYAAQLVKHRHRIREVVAQHSGFELGTEGDAFFLVFTRASDALSAAAAMQAALAPGPIRVRIGIHSGEPMLVDGDYVGLDVHKAARICSAAHGGQVLVSQASRDIVRAELRDLGEHRLKDLAAPERLFQLGEAEFPPPRTLTRTNLPVQPTPLLGRQAALAELLAATRTNRLLTLTGTGGTGKTRLALELAAELADECRDGVWWVPLAAISDASLVLPTIAQTLGAREELADYLADKQLLILLDNLEQVLDAARGIGELLAAAPDITILATSRERLGLAAEQEYPVPPLADVAAAELFVTRARQVRPDFEGDATVLEICRRLDRLPLALELAATRVKIMTPVQILARLEQRLGFLTAGPRDLPERQATIRATIDWSYELLSDGERRVFRALGVFAGSFELDAAEAVARASVDELQALVDKSLLRRTETGRFFLLETTREYAIERLEDADEVAELRRRHAEYFFDLAASAETALHSEQQGAWFERLHANNDNLRGALNWALAHDLARGSQLAATLFGPWRMRGQLTELIDWYERAFVDPEAVDATTRASGLATCGAALLFTGHYDRAEEALDESLALFRNQNDECMQATVLNRLGSVSYARGDFARAIGLHEQALAIDRRLGDRAGMAHGLQLLGENLRDIGEFGRAREVLEEAAAVYTQLGDRDSAVGPLHSLGDLALDENDPTSAADHYREALVIATALGDDHGQAYCIAGLAAVAAMKGDKAAAGRLWAMSESVENRLGLHMLELERARYERHVAQLDNDAEFRAGEKTTDAQSLADTVNEILAT